MRSAWTGVLGAREYPNFASSLFGVGGNERRTIACETELLSGGPRHVFRAADNDQFLCSAGGRFFVPA